MKKWLRMMGLMLVMPMMHLVAQTTITTTPPLTANNGSTAITFQVSSSTGVNITGISNTFNTGTISAQVWYRPGGVLVTGQTTPSVTTANGWVQAGTATITVTSNTTPTAIPITGLNIPVNAGAVVGICVTGGTRYMTYNSSLANTFSGGGATISTGPTFGFGGSFPSPTIATRSFVGSITVMPQGPCSNPPYLGNAVASNDTVCAGASFVLGMDTLTGGLGQSFQWQSSPNNSTWTNIAGATGASLSTNQSSSTYYRCYATCTASDTSGSVYVHVLSAITTPYTQNFDGAPASNNTTNPGLTDCWQYWESSGHNGYGYTYSSLSPNSAPNHMRFYNSNNTTDTMMIISPPIIGLDSSNKEVEFWAKSNSASYSSPISIGTMSNPSDPSTLDILATVMAPQNYTEFIVPIDISSGYNGTDDYLVIVYQNSTTYRYVYVDDIKIQAQPACPKPSLPVLGVTTSSSQVISWSSAGTNFNLEWGPTGFTQGTGQTGTSTTNSYTMTGLNGNTEYDVYIQNNCASAGNGISVWQGPITFKTLCNAFSGIITENFDAATSGSSSNNTTPDCWTYVKTSNGGSGYGYVYNSSTYANSPTKSFRMYSSNNPTYGDTMGIVSPEIAGMDTAFKRIEFWARSMYSGTSYDIKLVVGTVASPGQINTFSAIDTISIGNNTTYQYFSVYLNTANGYNGTHKHIAIVDASDLYDYPLIDDITISDIPSCTPSSGLAVSNITNSMADLSWIAGDGLGYNIEYGPAGFSQGTGPVITGLTGTSYSLTGLTGNTCYDVYVRDSCANSTSPWFGPITFCTSCDPLATPIVENFDATPTGSTINPSVPTCWGYWENPNASTSCYGYTYAFATPNGTKHFRMYSFYAATDSLALISPGVAGLTNGDKLIRFKAKSGSTAGSTQLLVGTSPSQSDMRNASIIDTIQTDIGTTYSTEFTVYLDTASGYNGTDQYVFIMLAGTPATYYQAYIDDISIESIPLCAAPWNISASNITASGATIDWSSYYGTAFQIEYGPTGFIPGTGLATTVSNVTSGTTITGLSPNTFYDVYVADNCDSSDQAGPYTFKTSCLVQLNGAYTVGGTPGPTNFATLDSALSVLNGCGITGPVTLNLQGGTHVIPATTFTEIVGASATNTVTFNGGGASVDTISFGAGLGTSIAMTFDGAGYISFENLTINASSSNRPIWLTNTAHHIGFDNCDIWGNPTSTSSLTSVIAASNSATSVSSTGNNANHISVTNCKIIGGYYGISSYGGGTTSYTHNFTLTDNEFIDQYYYPMRFYYADTLTLERNIVNGVRNTAGYGLYAYYTSNVDFKQNQIFVPTYAVYMYNANYNSSTSTSELSNNFLGSSNSYGLYVSIPNNVTIHHNSIRGGSYGCFLTSTASNVDVRNNIFVSNNNYALYIGATFTNFTLDYNIYHTGGSNIAYQGGAHATLAAWKTAQSSYNANSLQGDPGYLSNNDFHIIGTLPNNVGLNGLSSIDVDGDSRPASGSTTVDIGADEFTPLTWDASLDAILVSLAGCGDSTTTVEAVVTNFGLNTITSLPVTVNVTGGVTQALNFTSTVSLAQGATDTIMLGSINTYAGPTGVMFEGYSSLIGDQNSANDTLMVGPGSYVPFEPQYYPEDTVCANADSATFAAMSVPGAMYGWYASLTDTVPTAVGDSFTFPVAGQITWYLEYLSNSDSLLTTFAAGNGQNGNMFDLFVKNPVTITGFTIANTTAGAAEVYYKTGTYVGSETSAANWTNLTSTPVTVASTTGPTYVALPTPITLASGQTHAFYVTMSTGSVGYTNGTSLGSIYASNTDLDFFQGVGKSYPFGSTFSPRIWNGVIHYGSTGCSDTRQTLSLGINTDTAVAAFTHVVQANGADVDFDASSSVGQSYGWDFGDGTTGTGMMTSHTYATAGTFTACLGVYDSACASVDTICQTVLVTVGVEESLLNQTLNVFPNPNNGKFRVEFQVEGLKNVSIRVNTLLGQEVYSNKPGNVSGEYREEIDLSNEATGVYVLQILTDDNVISRRITIRK